MKLLIKLGLLSLFTFLSLSYSGQTLRYTSTMTSTPSTGIGVGETRNTYVTASGLDIDLVDMITLGINHNYTEFVSSEYELEVDVLVSPDTATPFVITLAINYNMFKGINYQDQDTYVFYNSNDYTYEIDAIRIDGVADSLLPKNVYLTGEIDSRRIVTYTGGAVSLLPKQLIDVDGCTGDDEITINWNTVSGGIEYQLEWTFVNNYDATVTASGSTPTEIDAEDLAYDFRGNSTRVTTTATTYTIPLLFERGYLLFRVRALGLDPAQPDKWIVGAWSGATSGIVDDFIAANTYFSYEVTVAHEHAKNWQVTTTFAEEGKKKEVISYYDGSLRNRQSVTKVNTDNNVIVGETIYDHQGRPAVNILPVPVVAEQCSTEQAVIRHYPNFNQNEDSIGYNRLDFDTTVTDCSTATQPMNGISGASLYYSTNNPSQAFQQGYVPDAENYPFTVVEYTPDNTGRIRRQSGVGPEFQLGSGHESKYYYGKPDQIQLDRLFGSEVGYHEHYKKNMVIDPNGQVSVSYLDQEGRVIATSLAGETPANLTSIASHATAEVELEQEMILPNEYTQTPAPFNNVNKMQFSEVFLVSSAGTYEFVYDLSSDVFSEECLPEICFHCIYDLKITLTDDCHVPILGADTLPIVIEVLEGHYELDTNDHVVFSTNCADSTLTDTYSFTAYLPVGNYNLHKTLTINEAAVNFYLNEYLDSANNSCVMTLNDFQEAYLAEIDTMDCYIDCEACAADLGNRDDFVAEGRGTAQDYDILLEACEAPCKSPTMCEVAYQMLLADVSPGGQYGEYLSPTGAVSAGMYPVSVFNQANGLPDANANWRYPTTPYADAQGVAVMIPVIEISTGVYTPAILPTTPGLTEIAPEDLVSLSVFIDNWQPSFAKSLIEYHPEYCYYETCIIFEEKDENGVSSQNFDSQLRTMTFFEAVTAGILVGSDVAGYDVNLSIEPLVANTIGSSLYTTLATELAEGVDDYLSLGGTMYSMENIAAATVNCGPQLIGLTTISADCLLFGADVVGNTSTENDQLREDTWSAFVAMYLSKKTEIINNYADEQAIASNCFNDCIGNKEFNPYAKEFFNTNSAFVFTDNPYFDIDQPCSWHTRMLYLNKQKRFPDPTDLNYDANEAAFHLYAQTGQCPVAMNFQNMLNEIVATDSLLANISHLEVYPSFVGLALALTGNDLSQSYGTLATTYAIDSLTNDYTLTIAGACNTVLSSDTTINWSEVVGFTGLSATVQVGLTYEFTIMAKLQDSIGNNYYEPLTGTTCFNILDCNFGEVCQPNALALDLELLFSTLASAGDFTTAFNIGTDADYIPFLTPAITHYFSGIGAIDWSLNLTTREALLTDGTTDLLVTFDPFTLAGGAPFSSLKTFTNINSTHGHYFSVEARGATGNLLAHLTGNVVLHTASDTLPISMGTCGAPTALGCDEAGHVNFTDLTALLSDELLDTPLSSINFYANPLFTLQLQSNFSFADSATTSSMNTVLDSGIYITTLTIVSDSCPIVLTFESTENIDFDDLIAMANFEVSGPTYQANYYSFTAEGSFATVSDTVMAIITGSSCIPLKKCESCDTTSEESMMLFMMTSMESSSDYKIDSTLYIYPELISVIDTLNLRLGYAPTDSQYVTPPTLKKSLLNGYGAFFANYERFLKHYNPAIDDSVYLYNIDKFIADYGNCINVDKEYIRYAATVQLYNQRAIIANVDTLTTVDRDFYIDNKMSCHCNHYLKHIDTCLNGNSIQAVQAVDYFVAHYGMDTTAVLDSNGLAYKAYSDAYKTFETHHPKFDVSSQYVKFASYSDVAQLNYFTDSAARSELVMYASHLMDTTSIAQPLAMSQKSSEFDIVMMAFSEESECSQMYAVYQEMIADYNASAYAVLNGDTLAELSFGVVESYCNCLPEYFEYLSPYLVTPANTNLPIPFNVDQFGCGKQMTPCEIAYENYTEALSEYHNYVFTEELEWPVVRTIRPDVFAAKQLCNCVDKYIAFLNAIVDGFITTEPTEEELTLTADYCADKPCTPDSPVMLDTIAVVTVPYTNPCVENMINNALSNAANAYNQYIDSLATAFVTNYKNHCINSLNESFKKAYTQREHHFTLYYYDQAGNLVKTVPPEGVTFFDITSSSDTLALQIQNDRVNHTQTVFSNHRLETKYMYNSLNQLVKQSLPDHDQMDVWELTLPNGLDAKLVVEDVHYISSNKGYLAGWIPTVVGGDTLNRGVLYTTNNGGNNWSKVNDIVASDIQAVQWTTSTQAFAVGTAGILLRSENGGASWDMVSLYEDGVTSQLNDLYLDGSGDGLLVGNNLTLIDYQNSMTDYAVVLTPVSTNASYPLSSTDHIKTLAYDATGSLYIIGVNKADGTMMTYTSSVSDKVNWTPQHQVKAEQYSTLSVVDDQTAFIAGDNGLLVKTTDGGDNWIVTETQLRNDIQHLFFKDEDQGVAIIAQHLYKTTDGGSNWTLLDDTHEYNSIEVYELTTTEAKLIAACDQGIVVKVLIKDNYPFGFIPYEVTTSNSTEDFTHAYAAKSGSIVSVIAVNGLSQLHHSPNIEAAVPAWTETSSIIGTIAQTRFKHTGVGTNLIGALITPTEKLYGFELGGSFVTTPLEAAEEFADLAFDNAGDIIAYGYSNNSLVTVDLTPSSITSSSQAVSTTTDTDGAQMAIDAMGTTWVVNELGNINQVAPTTFTISDQTYQVRPEWINDVVRTTTATVSLTQNGKVVNSISGLGTLYIAPTTENFNAAVTIGAITGMVGNGGVVYNFNGGVFTTATPFTTEDLTSIALQPSGTKLMIGGRQGSMWYIGNIMAPVYTLVANTETNAIQALALNSAGMTLAGSESSHLHFGMNALLTQTKNIYPGKLYGVDYRDETHGSVVGEHFFVRTTETASIDFDINLPTSGFTSAVSMELRAVSSHANGTLIVGTEDYIAQANDQQVGAPLVTAGTATLYDVAINAAGRGYAVGGETGAGVAYTTTNGGTSWTALTGVGTDILYGMHLFEINNTFMAVGEDGAVVYYEPISNTFTSFTSGVSENLYDVAFYDHQLGYLVGENGTLLRSLGHTWNNGAELILTAISFEPKDLTDAVTTQATNADKNIYAIGIADRYRLFVGGDYDSTSRYARVVHDESGEFSTYFYYDKLGRIVASQNSRQFSESPQKYSYTLYDELGRVVEAGEKTENTDDHPTKTFLDFNGSSDRIGFGASNRGITNKVTVEAWIKTSHISAGVKAIVTKRSTTGLPNYQLVVLNGKAAVIFSNNPSSSTSIVLNGVTTVSDNEWHHVSAVFNGNDIKLYVDGVLDASTTTTTTSPTYATANTFYIGYFGNYATTTFDGYIDEVRVWKTARTQEQIKDNKNKVLLGSEPGLVAYFKLNEGTGTTVTDYSVTASNGTSMGPTNPVWTSETPIAFESIFGTTISDYYNPKVIDDGKLLAWVNDIAVRSEVTRSYYDVSQSDIAADFPASFDPNQANLRKRIGTVTFESVYDGDHATYDYATHYDYDIHGNVKSLIQDNKKMAVTTSSIADNRFKRMDYSYDLISGNVHQVSYQPGEADAWYHRYEYDGDNRIKIVETSDNALRWQRDVTYHYYAHGPLARVELGENNVQGIDYAYTLQGWLKGVNSDQLNPLNDIGKDGTEAGTLSGNPNENFARDAFGFALHYFTNDYAPISTDYTATTDAFHSSITGSDVAANKDNLFNGNIGAMITTIKTPTLYTPDPNVTPDILPQGTAYKYDQLNRLLEARAFVNMDMSNNQWESGFTYDDRYFNAFKYDANGNILGQLRHDQAGNVIDSLTYRYARDGSGNIVKNRLYHVKDLVNYDAEDIDDMGAFTSALADINNGSNNYRYDATGQLIKDKQEGIDSIVWRVDGKIKSIIRNVASTKKNIIFEYDPMGNRIAKHQYSNTPADLGNKRFNINNPLGWEKTTYYNRDAQGNVMAVYDYDIISSSVSYLLSERNIYGSSRVGINTNTVEMIDAVSTDPHLYNYIGNRQYELSNHLGNVLSVVTDRKFGRDIDNDSIIDYYEPDILRTYDYSPFGVILQERHFHRGDALYKSVAPDLQWNFDGTLVEVNGSGRDGTAYNGATTHTDRCNEAGQAYYTDGVNDYIQIDDHADLDFGSSDFTVSIWVRKHSHKSWGVNAVSKWNTGASPGTNEWTLSTANSANGLTPPIFAIQSGTTTYTANSNANLSLGVWYHLVGVRDGDTLRIYVDGVQTGTTYVGSASVNNVTGRHMLLGKFAAGSPAHLRVDDLGIYHRALSAEEVNRLYSSVSCNYEGVDNEDYRYGFQGQEKDDEIKGEGNSVNYTYRMHDTRLGRFLSIDPLTSKYPYLTPYQFSSNQPIHAVELEGLESSNPLGAAGEWVEKAVNSAGALFNIIDNQTPSSSSNTVQTDVKNTAELTNTLLVAAVTAYNIANNIEVKIMANLNIRLSAGGRAAFSVEKVIGSDVDLGSVTLVSFEGSLNLRTGELNGTFNYLGKDGKIVFTQRVSKSVPAGLPGIGVGASTSTEEIISMENRATEQLTKELESGYGVGIFQAAGVLKTTENAAGTETEAGGKFGTGGAIGVGFVIEAEANVEITIGVKTP